MFHVHFKVPIFKKKSDIVPFLTAAYCYTFLVTVLRATPAVTNTHSLTPTFSFWQPYFFSDLGLDLWFVLYVLYVVISLLNWFSGNWQFKLYTPSHGTNFQHKISEQNSSYRFIASLPWLTHTSTKINGYYCTSLKEARATNSITVHLHFAPVMTLTEQSVLPCQPDQNLLWISHFEPECWWAFERFKLHHIWQVTMFCCCTKLNRLLKGLFNHKSPQCFWTVM